eukprot:sb/3464548/
MYHSGTDNQPSSDIGFTSSSQQPDDLKQAAKTSIRTCQSIGLTHSRFSRSVRDIALAWQIRTRFVTHSFHYSVSISEGTSRSAYEEPYENQYEGVRGIPAYVFDDNPSTCFHSSYDNQPEWLQLTLTLYNMIGKWELTGILLLHRLSYPGDIANRLLGTEITLLGTTTTTTCGTINSVNPNAVSIEDHSYFVFCPTATEPSIAVRLYDDVVTSNSDVIIINIAEVKVYELTIPFIYHSRVKAHTMFGDIDTCVGIALGGYVAKHYAALSCQVIVVRDLTETSILYSAETRIVDIREPVSGGDHHSDYVLSNLFDNSPSTFFHTTIFGGVWVSQWVTITLLQSVYVVRVVLTNRMESDENIQNRIKGTQVILIDAGTGQINLENCGTITTVHLWGSGTAAEHTYTVECSGSIKTDTIKLYDDEATEYDSNYYLVDDNIVGVVINLAEVQVISDAGKI